MTFRHPRWRLILAIAVPLACWAPASFANGDTEVSELLRFGTQMAKDGHWREAKFRWEQALKQAPDDPRLLNNLAVAEEALGAPERAHDLFTRAMALASRDGRIEANAKRSFLFWGQSGNSGAAVTGSAPQSGVELKKKGHDVVEVPVTLPLPPRLKLDGVKTILVASFLVNDSNLVDVNHELVRFLRSEFRKHTSFDVQDVTPFPAVPEQTLEDMAKNAAFFRWLGHEHGSDVIVTGAMQYTRRDASGFEDVDIVSEATGQKVHQTQFVEREEFTIDLDVLYFRGADGSLLFRDKMKREAVFKGKANDPISGFYELGSSIAGDVLSVVTSRNRTDARLLFKG